MTKLTESFHDGLVPRDRRLQNVKGHRNLRGRLGLLDPVPPHDETFGQNFFIIILVVVVFFVLSILLLGIVIPVFAAIVVVIIVAVVIRVARVTGSWPI